MPLSPKKRPESELSARCFGLRIESHMLQVAVATRLPDGRYQVQIDDIQCETEGGWLTASGASQLAQAVETLADRYEMRRQRVAVSLDGDFCVTRVTMGTAEEVDTELSMQADRVPRYLQLGPGEKATGSTRTRIAPNVDYAVTGVVNRSMIQLIYDALREADIDVAWVEPSLVGVARLVGQAEIGGEQPIMIADGTGTQWDVGIACTGRLLLDYRPASATNEQAFRNALDGHISRLKRFCLRHRGVATGELSRLMICGTHEKSQRAVETIGDSLGVTPEVLQVPKLESLYEIAEEDRQTRCVPAVATVLPLLIDVAESDVPDLLEQVRRAPELPLATRLLRAGWPVAAAMLIICISFGLVSSQRRWSAGLVDSRAEYEAKIDATEARFSQASENRELLQHLKRIESQIVEPNWDRMLGRITQTLPDLAKLNEYRVESDGQILLDGTVLDETIVYELVNTLRQLPEVTGVALKGTTPEESVHGTRFVIRLTTSRSRHESESGVRDE